MFPGQQEQGGSGQILSRGWTPSRFRSTVLPHWKPQLGSSPNQHSDCGMTFGLPDKMALGFVGKVVVPQGRGVLSFSKAQLKVISQAALLNSSDQHTVPLVNVM